MIIKRQKAYSKKNDAELTGEELAKLGLVTLPVGYCTRMVGSYLKDGEAQEAVMKHGGRAAIAGLGLAGAGLATKYIGRRVRKRREAGQDNVKEKKKKSEKDK